MIRLHRPPEPPALSHERESLIERFRKHAEAVWNATYLRDALMTMSFGKCAYCEAQLRMAAQYMEVDHFYPKARYPERVVDWTNLLPACRFCNATKGAHDVGMEMIINPAEQDPRDHLEWSAYHLHARTATGNNTIEVLNINDHQRQVMPRFLIGQSVKNTLTLLLEKLNGYAPTALSTRAANQIIRICRQLLEEAQPASEYGSTAATVLEHDPRWIGVVDLMKTSGLWDHELQAKYEAVRSVAY